MKRPAAPLAASVDFGGTGVKLALVDAAGRVRQRLAFDTRDASAPADWMRRVHTAIQAMADRAGVALDRLAGVGVGAPGFVDFDRGVVLTLPNVPGWDDVPLAPRLAKRLGLPVWLENDVNAMALGESKYGAGRTLGSAVFLTLGTGVGGGIVFDGRLHRGAHGLAGEIGHHSIELHGHRTPTGIGGLETYIGNGAIVSNARARLAKARKKSALAKLPDLSVKDIALAAQAGDAVGVAVFDHVAECLASALASVSYLLQPEAFIIGGGVAQAGAVLFDPLHAHLKRRLHPRFCATLRVLPAALGPDAGLAGCAALVRQNLP